MEPGATIFSKAFLFISGSRCPSKILLSNLILSASHERCSCSILVSISSLFASGTANLTFPERLPCVTFIIANGISNSDAASLFVVIPPRIFFESSAEHFNAIRPPNWERIPPVSRFLRDCVDSTMWIPHARPCLTSIVIFSMADSFVLPANNTWNSSITTRTLGIVSTGFFSR